MTYEWEFNTANRPLEPRGQKCHRGPMIDIEVVMSQPFTIVSGAEVLRKLLLEKLVDINLVAVQTRECLLRTLNSNVGPLFNTVNPRYNEIKALICEKRNSVVIDRELSSYDFQFLQGIQGLKNYGVNSVNISVLEKAFKSSSPILRVAARCAYILTATQIEMR